MSETLGAVCGRGVGGRRRGSCGKAPGFPAGRAVEGEKKFVEPPGFVDGFNVVDRGIAARGSIWFSGSGP